MKFTINTQTLQDMVAKAVKGASNNKMIALTQLMNIKLKDNKLTLVTTDASNYLYITQDKVPGDDFEVVVPVDIFSKLVSKTTSEKMTFELNENMLEVKGNGKYSIELILDENGSYIEYPNPLASMDLTMPTTAFNLSTAKIILESVKPAIAKTTEVPCYTNYFVGDKVVATDTFTVAGLDIDVLQDSCLVSSETMDLLATFTEENISIYTDDEHIVFTTSSATVYAPYGEGYEDYAIDAISGLLTQEFDSQCAVEKRALLNVLDRISLFISPYDKNAVTLTFTSGGLMINSTSNSGTETLDYKESDNFTEFTCSVDVEMLKAQVKATSSDLITIEYSEDNAIKLQDGNVTVIIALLDEEE